MKILISFFVLFFTTITFAENYYCNVDVHGFDKIWKDYEARTVIIEYDNNNMHRIDTTYDTKTKYNVIKNNNEIITGILLRKNGQINSFRSITIYKKELRIVSIYYDHNGIDNGITTLIGSCNIF